MWGGAPFFLSFFGVRGTVKGKHGVTRTLLIDGRGDKLTSKLQKGPYKESLYLGTLTYTFEGHEIRVVCSSKGWRHRALSVQVNGESLSNSVVLAGGTVSVFEDEGFPAVRVTSSSLDIVATLRANAPGLRPTMGLNVYVTEVLPLLDDARGILA